MHSWDHPAATIDQNRLRGDLPDLRCPTGRGIRVDATIALTAFSISKPLHART